jgi:16S rRNA C967 or C1407 C5-methylase (RsmB/RsmF family)/NOL1/NOP2/fmu family ribosome biogenesis protein
MSNKFPPQLVKKLGENPLFDAASFLEIHEVDTAVTSIRLNAFKKAPTWLSNQEEIVPWCAQGIYLANRPKFTLDPFFHAGCYYVQEASSMFLAHAIKELGFDKKPGVVVDLCAAPGGKSTLLQSYLHPESLLIANELIKSRVQILEENLTRWGHASTLIAHSDPSAFGKFEDWVDVLVVDAPCSGSGMFRKDQEAISEWSESAVKLCSERQQRILATSIDCLKPGGYLIYSTCSYSEEENEEMADWLLNTNDFESVELSISPNWGISVSHSKKHHCPGYRFYPHLVKGEGFFLTVLKKKGEYSGDHPSVSTAGKNSKGKNGKNSTHDQVKISEKTYANWVESTQSFHAFLVGEQVHLIPEIHRSTLAIAQQNLYLKSAGLRVGKLHKGEILIPDHALAMSIHLHPKVPRLSVDYKTALEFLRKNTFSIDEQANLQLGWNVVTYEGAALGWAKVMPGRINNYYPKESRIVNL